MYQTEVDGQHHELGTSGFLYRSNKLMYDHATKSLWSTLQGEPVVGALVEKDIQLERRHVVTTNWEAWKKLHPDTTVLSLNTGVQRDYGEGVAYREYFANDKLMFDVPGSDDRLLNKDHVLAFRDDSEQLAISVGFLKEHPVHHDRLGNTNLIVLTEDSGASRAYLVDNQKFESWNGVSEATDSAGQVWTVTEAAIERNDTKLVRMPSHRAFWFGWIAQYPNTRLVK